MKLILLFLFISINIFATEKINVEELVKQLADSNSKVRKHAFDTLKSHKKAVSDKLKKHLKHSDPEVRMSIKEILRDGNIVRFKEILQLHIVATPEDKEVIVFDGVNYVLKPSFTIRDFEKAWLSKDGFNTSMNVSLRAEHSEKMKKLTETNITKRFAVIFKGRLVFAPAINEAFGKEFQITGDLEEEQFDEIIKAVKGEKQ